MRFRLSFLVLGFAAIAAWCADASAEKKSSAVLQTLKGESLKGDLTALTEKQIVIKQNGKSVATPVEQVLKLDFPTVAPLKPEGKYADVELTDGSRFHCTEWSIKGKQIDVKTMAGPKMQLPLAAVSNILIEAQDEKNRKDWSERLARKRRHDLAVAMKDGTINSYEGTFGEGDAEGHSIVFQNTKGTKGKLVLAKLHGLIFQRELDPQAPPMLCKLFDSYGDFFVVSSTEKTPTGIAVATPSGARLEIAAALLTRLDYTLDKLAFLSRMEPSKVVQTSNFDFVDTYRRDKNLDNGPLRIYDENYSNGLALHAHTELEYDLKGDYREFHALAGIDQTVGGVGGPVVLVIQGVIDGETKELYKKTFTRKERDKKEGVINLNIKDVQKLRVIVRTGDLFDTGKHLDLVNAKVQK